MWWIIGFLLLLILISKATAFLKNARKDVNQTIGEMVLASRIPSGRMTVEEMQQRDIYPYFCPEEYRMVWVEHPVSKETCPWCNGPLVPFS